MLRVSTAVTAFTPLRTVYSRKWVAGDVVLICSDTVLGKGAELAPEAIQERLKEVRTA